MIVIKCGYALIFEFTSLSPNFRMTFVQFAVTSLDLLKKTDALNDTGRKKIIEWIYHLQITKGCMI